MNELALLLERVRQNRQARSVALVEGRLSTPCAESRLGCVFRAGARVFDTVSGKEGAVISSTIEQLFIAKDREAAAPAAPAAFKLPGVERVELVSVRLDAGPTVIRQADELIAR